MGSRDLKIHCLFLLRAWSTNCASCVRTGFNQMFTRRVNSFLFSPSRFRSNPHTIWYQASVKRPWLTLDLTRFWTGTVLYFLRLFVECFHWMMDVTWPLGTLWLVGYCSFWIACRSLTDRWILTRFGTNGDEIPTCGRYYYFFLPRVGLPPPQGGT